MNASAPSTAKEVIAAAVLLALIVAISGIVKLRPRGLNREAFQKRWKALQKQCADKSTWALAVIDADKLLDEALKKRNYKGKTMGERLVSAQRDLSHNDGVWFAHKLRNQLVHENTQLEKRDVTKALIGIRQALKDLGAL